MCNESYEARDKTWLSDTPANPDEYLPHALRDGKRWPITSAESQTYIDEGELPTGAGRWLVVNNGTITPTDAVTTDRLTAMQGAVGGHIERFMTMPSRHRPGVEIDCYCNEDGIALGLLFNCTVETELEGFVFEILGPVLVCGADENGDTIGLTAEEIADVRLADTGAQRFPMTIASPLGGRSAGRTTDTHKQLQFRGVGSWQDSA